MCALSIYRYWASSQIADCNFSSDYGTIQVSKVVLCVHISALPYFAACMLSYTIGLRYFWPTDIQKYHKKYVQVAHSCKTPIKLVCDNVSQNSIPLKQETIIMTYQGAVLTCYNLLSTGCYELFPVCILMWQELNTIITFELKSLSFPMCLLPGIIFGLFVGWLLNVPATCECTSRTR